MIAPAAAEHGKDSEILEMKDHNAHFKQFQECSQVHKDGNQQVDEIPECFRSLRLPLAYSTYKDKQEALQYIWATARDLWDHPEILSTECTKAKIRKKVKALLKASKRNGDSAMSEGCSQPLNILPLLRQ